MSDQKTPSKALRETVIQNTAIDDNHAPTSISLFIVSVLAMDDNLDSAQAALTQKLSRLAGATCPSNNAQPQRQ